MADDGGTAPRQGERTGEDRRAEPAAERPENVPPHADRRGDQHHQAGKLLQRVEDAPEDHTGEEVTARRDEQGVEALLGAAGVGPRQRLQPSCPPPPDGAHDSEAPALAGLASRDVTDRAPGPGRNLRPGAVNDVIVLEYFAR